jgi:S-adenosylmethionine/arginine decarboxylase-like enzyme
MENFWGYHLMLDCKELSCEFDLLNDEQYLRDFVKEMLVATDMKPWGEPLIARLTDDDGTFPDALSGFTVVQLLHTSNLTLHICDLTRTLYFDLFSCKRFSQEKAIDVIKKFFDPQGVRVTYLTRHAD